MLKARIMKALSFAFLLTSVAACMAAPQKTDTYTRANGEVMLIETSREACQRACNEDYDRCSETGASEGPVARGQMDGVLGSASECRADLKSCFADCKARKE